MNFINGSWVKSDGVPFASKDPYYQKVIWQGNIANEAEVNEAILTAEDAFASWQHRPFQDRANIIKKFAELVEKDKDSLALLIASETAKPLWEAKQEVSAVISKVDISIQSYLERTGTKDFTQSGMHLQLAHKPIGMMVVLGPFNFPAHLPCGHIVPALLAGNVCIFKPSEQTPAVAEKIVKYWQAAGLPNGVLNLLQGNEKPAQALLASPKINAVLFTGSNRVGEKIHAQCAAYPDRLLAMEMGGNNALIVWDVKDIEAAATLTIQSAFATSGQRCTCARRLIVPDAPRGEAFLNILTEKTKAMRIGAWDAEPQPFMGALIHAEAAQAVVCAQNRLDKQGAEVLLSGVLNDKYPALVTPSVVDLTSGGQPHDEEVFGPLLQVQRVSDDFDLAINLANNSEYGLALGVFSDKREHFDRLLKLSRSGVVNWNKPLTGASSHLPFGGVGKSGNFRPSAYYAADYCAYPVASITENTVQQPDVLPPGLEM